MNVILTLWAIMKWHKSSAEMSSKQDNESYHDQDRNQLEQPVDSNNSSMGFDIESADYLNLKSIAIT